MVRSSSEAPSAVKEAPPIELPLHQAHGAGVAIRQDGLRPVGRGGDGFELRAAMVSSASSQEMRSKRPSPLLPMRFIGCITRSGEYVRSR